jgi:hypothetical protein
MKLVVQEAAFGGYTDIYRLTAAAITALGTGNQVKIATVPAGGIVTNATVFEVTNFAGTSTDLTLDVGTTVADPDEYIDALDLDGLTKVAFCTGDGFTSGGDAGTLNGVINNTTGALDIKAEVNFTGTVTGGEWLVALTILNPGGFTA